MLNRSILACCAVLLSGCTVWTDLFPPSPPSEAQEITDRNAARVIPFQVCPVSGLGGTQANTPQILPLIAAAAIPFVVNLAQKAVTEEMARAQANLTTTWNAYGTPPVSTPVGCLVVVRGRFGLATASPRDKLTTEVLGKIGASTLPSLYVEIAVINNKNGVRTFEPVFYQYNSTAAHNPGNGQKTVGILLAFTQKPIPSITPGSDQLSKADIVVPFALGTLRQGTWLMGGGGGPRDPFADQLRTVPVTVNGTPMPENLDSYAIVTESADQTLFDTILQKAVADKSFSDALQGAITAALPAKAASK